MSESDDYNQGNDSYEESSESSSDDEEILDVTSDTDFFKTLSCLKNKDPIIYDKNVQFFSNITKPDLKENKNSNVKRSVFVKDYVVNFFDEKSNEENEPKPLVYAQENLATEQIIKNELKADSDDENGDSFMKNKEEDEAENIQFCKGNKIESDNKEEDKDLKSLFDPWNGKDIDEKEEFLKDYILNRRYLSQEESATIPNNENLSEDERELEEQAEFEDRYNRRFESEDNLQIRRFPRKVDGSLRKKDDSRKKKRAEISQRKREEKDMKRKEIKKKQKEKLHEIEEKVQKLKAVTGNLKLCFKDEEILEDFDPEKHDQRMSEVFNEDYYNEGEEDHPGFDANEYNWDYGDINMDCEGNNSEESKKKLTRSKMKKLKKKKGYTDIMDIVKPSFDPNVHNNFKEYFDEFYNLDCEDFIDDLPCRFKYREVVPNDFGLTVEEILMADDRELNQWASIKKICKRRPEHVEKNEVKIYSKKASDENLKRKIFCSLYSGNKDETQEGESICYDNPNILPKENKSNPETAEVNNMIKNNELDKGENKRDILKENKRKKNKKCEVNENIQEDYENIKERSVKRKQFSESKVSCNGASSASKDIKYTDTDKEDTDHVSFNGHSSSTDIKKIKKRKSHDKNHKGVLGDADVITSVNNLENGGTDEYSIDKVKRKKFNEYDISNHPHLKKNIAVHIENSNNKDQINRPFKKKHKFGKSFKSRTNDLTELSDNRLKAYGLKPKQFRAKIKYAKKN